MGPLATLLSIGVGFKLMSDLFNPKEDPKKAEKERQLEEERKRQREAEWEASREARRKREEEEKRRRTSSCHFDNGISEDEFHEIVLFQAKRIKRITDVRFLGLAVAYSVRSNSGISDWWFITDFNDYGFLTGKYWLKTNNSDSSIPKTIASRISEEVCRRLNNNE